MKEKKNIFVGVRFSLADHQTLKERAASCGMSLSSYIRTTSLGIAPRLAMSPEELAYIHDIAGVRRLVVKFVNAVNGKMKKKNQKEREAFLLEMPHLQEWWLHLQVIADDLKRIITYYNSHK